MAGKIPKQEKKIEKRAIKNALRGIQILKIDIYIHFMNYFKIFYYCKEKALCVYRLTIVWTTACRYVRTNCVER